MKIRNISGVDLAVPELSRVVKADAVIDVPDSRVDGYTCQESTWKAVAAVAPKKSEEKE